jgi:hypothetical protein
MAQVILFGGGDGGGIRITENGVEPIPPFDPALQFQLRGINALTQAAELMRGQEGGRDLSDVAGKLGQQAVGRMEAIVGSLDADVSVIFQDGDDGFVCGSTGKPPIPFPKGPR